MDSGSSFSRVAAPTPSTLGLHVNRVGLLENDLGLVEAVGPLDMSNALEVAGVCGGTVTPDGVMFPWRDGLITAPWGMYLVSDGFGWGVAAYWWVDGHQA